MGSLGCSISYAQTLDPHTGQPLPISIITPQAGVVAWDTLNKVENLDQKSGVPTNFPKFSSEILQLDSKKQVLEGFMLPLDQSEQQSHFILAAAPPSCPFCLPGGPTSLVEIEASSPISYRDAAVKLRGTFHVISKAESEDSDMGFIYRVTEAEVVE